MCLRSFAFGSVLVFAIATLLACGSNSTMGGGAGGNLGASGGAIPGGSGGAGGNAGASCHASGTITVVNNGFTSWTMDGVSNDPALTLCRGSTYTFSVNATGHIFYIKTMQSIGAVNAYDVGVTGNGATVGDVIFVVPASAPDSLVYQCGIHLMMSGTLHIVN